MSTAEFPMKTAGKTIAQFVAIGIVGLIAGFAANAIRAEGTLKVSKNYFAIGDMRPPTNGPVGTTVQRPDPTAEDAASGDEGHLQHPYQRIGFKEIVALLDDPLTRAGLNVFVDARDEQHFADGHIPGAMLCSPYQVGQYIDAIVDGQPMSDRLLAAEKIVVYCNGGDCEDSIFMCRELLELDIPSDAIYLYDGGWNDWTEKGGEVRKGMD